MNRIWIVLILAAIAGWALPTAVTAQELNGAQVYSENCGRCHQPRAPWEFSDQSWDIIIHHMHVRGFLSEAERMAVLAYLQQNNVRAGTAPALPEPAMMGPVDAKTLIAQKGCQGCHIIGGTGGAIGPNLDTVYSRRDAEYIVAKLTNPTFDNPRSVMPYFGLSDAQKKAITEYLKTLSGN